MNLTSQQIEAVLTGEPAWRLVNKLHEQNLANLIYAYGEDRYSRRIARAIVSERHRRPIMTAAHLAEVVRRAVPGSPHARGEHIDSRTDPFSLGPAAHDTYQDDYNAAANPASWQALFAGRIASHQAIYDGLDLNCGNQLLAGASASLG